MHAFSTKYEKYNCYYRRKQLNKQGVLRNAKTNDIVQVANTASGIPNDSNAVCASLRDFGNGLPFAIGPDEHVVNATQYNLFVVLAIKIAVLDKKAGLCRHHIHILDSPLTFT